MAALVPAAAAQAATTPDVGIQIKIGHSGKCLNVAGGSTADKAKIIQYGCSSTAVNEKFEIVPQAGNVYWIRSVSSGKCLNVEGGSVNNNAAIIQYTCSYAANTLWKVDEVSEKPTVRFVSVSSGRCLNISGASTADNAALVQYGCTTLSTALNEQFYLPPTASPVAVHQPFTTKQPIAVVQGVPSTAGAVAPVYYSYIGANDELANQLAILIDRNPDPANTDPTAPEPVFVSSFNFGYTGRTYSSPLRDGRVQVVSHDAAAGDVVLADEELAGTGDYGDLPDIGGAMAAQPTVGPYTADGVVAAYAVIGGALWYSPESADDLPTAYGAWRSLGGTGLTGTPVSVRTATGVRIFALDTTGHVRTATLTGGSTLSDWSDLGGSGLTGTLSVVAGPSGLDSVFARSGDGTIVTKTQGGDGTFPAPWTSVGDFPVAGSPSAVLNVTPGQIAVVARGTDDTIYLAYETARESGEYTDWKQITETAAASDPTAFSYDVPSGRSFGVAYQSTDDSDLPAVLTFDPVRTSAAATGTIPHAKLHKLTEPAKKGKLAG